MSDHTRRLSFVALSAFALILLPSAARAQRSQPSSRAAARAEMEMREQMLWELDKIGKEQPARVPDTRPSFEAVAEDFKQLQLVNYSLAAVADPRAALDYARVRKESGEVRKRAARLRGYLSLPAVESDGKRDKAEIQTPEALRSAVKKLDELVNSFAWNPVFQRPGVVDLELSTKASRDLAGILAISEQIRKSAEALNKR